MSNLWPFKIKSYDIHNLVILVIKIVDVASQGLRGPF